MYRLITQLNAGEDYYVVVTKNLLAIRWDFFRKTIDGISLSQNELVKTKYSREALKYLVASARGPKVSIKEVYGSQDFVSDIIQIYANTGILGGIYRYEVPLKDFSYGAYTISVERELKGKYGTATLSGFKYAIAEQKSGFSAHKLQAGKQGIKTLEQIRDMGLLDFMYENGNMIKDYRLITTQEQLSWVKDQLSTAEKLFVSWDTEDSGLNFFWYGGDESLRSRILGMSLSWEDNQAVYIPFEMVNTECLGFDQIKDELIPIMNRHKIVTHNGQFDYRVGYSYGVHVNIKEDTHIMAFNIDPTVSKGSKALKPMTRQYFNVVTPELEDILGNNFDPELVAFIDPELLMIYGCADADYTRKLFFKLKPYLQDEVPYRLDCKLIPILAKAEFYSSKLNMELLRVLSNVNRVDLKTLEDLMYNYIEEVGMRTQAIKFIQSVQGKSYEPSQAEVEQVVSNPQFREGIQFLFRKQTKKAQASSNPDEYRLSLASSLDVVHILYNILDYPVTQVNPENGRWMANEEALEDLMSHTTKDPVHFLKTDVISDIVNTDVAHYPSEEIILSKKDFETYKYPFAYMMSKWRELYKFRTSFFDKLENTNTNGWYCETNKITAAETARVINPIQTLVGSLKQLVLSHSDDYYLVIFDMNQIEFRVMLGLANEYWLAMAKFINPQDREAYLAKSLTSLIERLNNYEADYHREGGAVFAGCTPEDMTKQQRSEVKAVHFSVPYGSGAYSIAEKDMRYAKSEEEAQNILMKVEATLAAWRKNLYPLQYFLESVRAQALVPVSEEYLPPLKKDRKLGRVSNALGRYRWFELEDMTPKKKATIGRMAGNYPIQSFAREIFFTAMYKLEKRIKKEGYSSGIPGSELMYLNLFVHDECHLMVHKSIHPYKVFKMIRDECLTKIPGHPNYYMGISIVDNWGEGKLDKYEAPLDYVMKSIERYDSNPGYYDNQCSMSANYKDLVFAEIKEYMTGRFVQELERLLNGEKIIEPVHLNSIFKNYFLKARYSLYTKPNPNPEYKEDKSISKGDNSLAQHMCQYLIDYYGKDAGGYSLIFNGEVIPVSEWYLEPDNAEVDDLDLDLGFDEDSELFQDSLDIETRNALEFYALSHHEISVPAVVDKTTGAVTYEVNKPNSNPWMGVVFEDFNGNIVVSAKGCANDNVIKAAKFLRKSLSPNGKPLVFFTGNKIETSLKVDMDSIDKKRLYEILHPEFSQTELFCKES